MLKEKTKGTILWTLAIGWAVFTVYVIVFYQP